MLEASALLENSAAGGAAVATATANQKNDEGGGGAVSGGSGPEERGRGEDSDRSSTGNRWPREETLALLKIRSDMDVAFRDATLKAPLWDEVSRKLGELGYHRSSKKCKEKFENIYKYHKRTKECRSGRPNGKNYRFFDQLELLENQPSFPSPCQNKNVQQPLTGATMAKAAMTTTAEAAIKPSAFTDASIPEFMMSTSTSATSSSGKQSQSSGKGKRKLMDYFERLMKQVLEKQENLHNKFIEALERCEKDRAARDEAWKMQEMGRIKREQETLAQERAIAAAKDAAVIAFLQKISDQPASVEFPNPNPNPNPNPADKFTADKVVVQEMVNVNVNVNNNTENSIQPAASPSRWPKGEVEALIKLRTNLDLQYQDNGPKGPLWEEISNSMKRLGYNRSAKRCKEKWENINKYFKRVKESKKKRPEDSKTCPYFQMLQSIYENKPNKRVTNSYTSSTLKPEDILLQMQQQLPPPPPPPPQLDQGGESENQEDDGEEEDDDNGDNFQIVGNNPSSVTSTE